MGSFLAVSAFRSASAEKVSSALSDYLTRHGVSVKAVTPDSPSPGTDALIYAPANGWTVVLWPEYFNVHDFPLVRTVATVQDWLVSTVHVYDDEYWEHLAHLGPIELHAFCSRPHFWEDEAPAEMERVAGLDSTPERLAAALHLPAAILQPYLVDVDSLSSFDQQAYPSDAFPLGDFWVFTDFWRRLGIRYPDPSENSAATLRLAKDFSRRLPSI